MRRAWTVAWGAALAVATSTASTAWARPRPLPQSLPQDARRDYDAGKLLFEDGDFATALLKYQAAYDATHDARLLWDVAVCEKSLRHYARALSTLGRYLAEGGDLLTAADRRDAQELSRAITPFVSAQALHVSEDGAQIWIDERLVGLSPLPGPVVLDIGTRRVRVQKEGFRTWDRGVPVGGSASTDVPVTLERATGHLDLTAPNDAVVRIDDREVGRGPSVSLDLPAGAHALRVTAPHMRPLARDVLVEDGKQRSVELAMEADSAPSSQVHVTVGCARTEPRPEDQLSVFFDDATESSPPLGVRLRREPGHDTIAYVPYGVSPGRHAVHVATLGCDARDTTVDAPEGGYATVTGALPPSDRWFGSSPAGSHDGWRISGGLVESSISFADYQNFFTNPGPTTPATFTMWGASVSAGIETRWTTGLVDARFQVGRTSVQTAAGSDGGAGSYDNTTLSEWAVGLRPGFRIPLYVAALSAGIGGYIGQYFFSPGDASGSNSGTFLSGAAWAAIDVQPWCEWGVQVGTSLSSDGFEDLANSTSPGVVSNLWFHAAFTPNQTCGRQRDGLFRIQGNAP